MEGKEKMAYGQWLKVEVKEFSPYWRTLYEAQEQPVEEVIPETPLPLVYFQHYLLAMRNIMKICSNLF